MTPLNSERAKAMAAARWAKRPMDTPYTGTFLEFLDATGRGGPSRATWRCFWRVADGLPLTDEGEVAVFRRHTGRETPPTKPAAESWVCAGRRAGKEAKLADARRDISGLWRRCDIWELSPSVCRLAAEVAPGHRLRTLDALHLAA